MREGSEESPILHLRLSEPYETIEEDEDKLKEVVAVVSCVKLLAVMMLANKLNLKFTNGRQRVFYLNCI